MTQILPVSETGQVQKSVRLALCFDMHLVKDCPAALTISCLYATNGD
jgi:hypothetical protein